MRALTRAARVLVPRAANRCCALQLGADDPELVLLDLRRTFRTGCLVPETHPCSRSPGLPILPVPSSWGRGEGPRLSLTWLCASVQHPACKLSVLQVLIVLNGV